MRSLLIVVLLCIVVAIIAKERSSDKVVAWIEKCEDADGNEHVLDQWSCISDRYKLAKRFSLCYKKVDEAEVCEDNQCVENQIKKLKKCLKSKKSRSLKTKKTKKQEPKTGLGALTDLARIAEACQKECGAIYAEVYNKTDKKSLKSLACIQECTAKRLTATL
jgi:hypothetical protein